MRSVLGIDAAWTLTQPSGVALAIEGPNGWRLLAVESSYKRFQALADTDLEAEERPSGSRPDVPALLASAVRIANGPINIVVVDMRWPELQSKGGVLPTMQSLSTTGHANAERTHRTPSNQVPLVRT